MVEYVGRKLKENPTSTMVITIQIKKKPCFKD